MASGEVPAHSGPAPATDARPPAELRRGVVGFGGGATVLAVILALIASLFVASSIGQLAKHMPSAGSFYTYVSNGIHPGLGFLVGWAFELALLVGGAFLATQLGIIVSGTLTSGYARR